MEPKPTTEMPPQKETISLEEAMKRCEHWAETFHKMVPEADVIQTPRAVWFHWADIEQIVRDYRPHYPVNGVRIYFAMTPNSGEYQIKGLMVPTVPDENDPTKSNDLIIKVPVVPRGETGNTLGDDDEGDSIYDFSRPCPAFCDGGVGRSIY